MVMPTCYANMGNWEEYYETQENGLHKCLVCGTKLKDERECLIHLGVKDE